MRMEGTCITCPPAIAVAGRIAGVAIYIRSEGRSGSVAAGSENALLHLAYRDTTMLWHAGSHGLRKTQHDARDGLGEVKRNGPWQVGEAPLFLNARKQTQTHQVMEPFGNPEHKDIAEAAGDRY